MSARQGGKVCQPVLVLVFAMALVAGTLSGCGRSDQSGEEAAAEQASGAAAYPSGLSADSSPGDVARVLINALEAGDRRTLLGLVALEVATEEVAAIFKGRASKMGFDQDDVPALTVMGWSATYAFFEKGATEVTRETVTGDTATVLATGTVRSGDSQTLIISLVREEEVWKVKPGLKSM